MWQRWLPIWLVLMTAGAGLFFDALWLVGVVGGAAALLAILFAGLIWRKKIYLVPVLPEVLITWSVWCGLVIVFGLRSLQIAALWLVVPLGILFLGANSLLWWNTPRPQIKNYVLWLVSSEWFVLLLFAPASFFLLAILVTLWFVLVARALTQEKFWRLLIVGVIALPLIMLMFNWTL